MKKILSVVLATALTWLVICFLLGIMNLCFNWSITLSQATGVVAVVFFLKFVKEFLW